ncbi:MAG: hypothetical protein LBL07_19320 [Tannerella sp.]|jgi:hypothetical protein|nr:hypothetical protein [Tannerella sp.]
MRNILRTCLFVALLATAGSYAYADGDINISTGEGTDTGTSWNFANSTLTITEDDMYTITGSGQTGNRILVNPGVKADITIENENIVSSGIVFHMTGAEVNLTLSGNNVLRSGSNYAGLSANTGATLVITASSNGSLEARGGSGGAGIGGIYGNSNGNITINGGTINAYGAHASNGAGTGIGSGGGSANNNGTITINGGTVYAESNSNNNMGSAGIGGRNSGGTIIINGGTVTARCASGSGAGIGAGITGPSGGTITINGGIVTAYGDNRGAGIGGGCPPDNNYQYLASSGGNVTINGGTVTANGGGSGAAISGGNGGGKLTSGALTVNGGSLKMNNHSGTVPKNGASANVYLNTLAIGNPAVANNTTITAGSIDGTACSDGIPSGGSYGIKDMQTRDNGRVYLYLPSTTGNGSVALTANGKEYSTSYTRGVSHSSSQTLFLPYGIALNRTGISNFYAGYGYDAQTQLDFNVINIGSNNTGDLTIELDGTNHDRFELSTSSVPSITTGSSMGGFTVKPEAELAVGSYTATVRVSGDNNINASFDVNFTVYKANLTVADLGFDLATHVTYSGSPQSLKVTAPGIVGAAITVYYNGDPAEPTGAGSYPVTVNIDRGANYVSYINLSLGGDFVIDGAIPEVTDLEFDLHDVPYDGSPHPLTVEPNPELTASAAQSKYIMTATCPRRLLQAHTPSRSTSAKALTTPKSPACRSETTR